VTTTVSTQWVLRLIGSAALVAAAALAFWPWYSNDLLYRDTYCGTALRAATVTVEGQEYAIPGCKGKLETARFAAGVLAVAGVVAMLIGERAFGETET
jgi:hypothetical protein